MEYKGSEVECLKSQLKEVLTIVTDLVDKCDKLQNEVKQMKESMRISTIDLTTKPRKLSPHMERNVQELRTLSCSQVRVKINYYKNRRGCESI